MRLLYCAGRDRGRKPLSGQPGSKCNWRPRHTLGTITVAPFRAWRGSRASVGEAKNLPNSSATSGCIHIAPPRSAGVTPPAPPRSAGAMPPLDVTGGEGGIRTRGTFRYTRFPVVHLRPLGHLSNTAVCSHRCASIQLRYIVLSGHSSGERGIRTHGALADTLDFESSTFGHSVSSPPRNLSKAPLLSTTRWPAHGAS